MLKVSNLCYKYENVTAITDISINVKHGELVTLIGSNGAGKSTILKVIAGLLKADQGSIEFENTAIQDLPPHRILDIGIACVAEGRRIFPKQSVVDNLILGAFSIRKKTEIVQDNISKVFQRFPVLKTKAKHPAGTLSGGEQQMLAIAQAIMSNPKLVLFDEPSLGLAPLLVKEMFSVIRAFKEQGISILLVEQLAFQAIELCDRGYVLQNGRLVIEGTRDELLNNPHVEKAYLGA